MRVKLGIPVYTGENRIYHKPDSNFLDTTQDESNKYYVNLYACSSPFSNEGSPTVISEEVLVVSAEGDNTESIDVTMNHVGTAIDLRLKFSDLIEGFDLTLTGITFGGVPDGGNESDYTLVPYDIWTDLYAGVDDDNFVYKSGDGNRYYDVDMPITETNTEYSVQFGTLPFTIEDGKKLNITLQFNNNNVFTKSSMLLHLLMGSHLSEVHIATLSIS